MLKFWHLLILLISLACLELRPANPSSSMLTQFGPSVETGDFGKLCNGTTVPYPFGISGLSRFYPGFDLTCIPEKGLYLYLFYTNLRFLDISLDEGFIRVEIIPFIWNSNTSNTLDGFYAYNDISLDGSPYTFSETLNKLTVLGCDSMVLLSRHGSTNSSSGCVSFCVEPESAEDGICSGVGCCQAAIPPNMKNFKLELLSIRNLTGSNEFPILNHIPIYISRVYILEQKTFEFSIANSLMPLPAVLNWSIGNKTCDSAKKSGDCICADKAECRNSSSGIGYLCRCVEGYEGNPYLKGGCKDINE